MLWGVHVEVLMVVVARVEFWARAEVKKTADIVTPWKKCIF